MGQVQDRFINQCWRKEGIESKLKNIEFADFYAIYNLTIEDIHHDNDQFQILTLFCSQI